jgi:hypothetical protein
VTLSTETGRALIRGAPFPKKTGGVMQIKMLEPKIVLGIPRVVEEVVDVPVEMAREFVSRKWAISEESVKAEALAKTKNGDLVKTVAGLTTTIEAIGESFDAMSDEIDSLSERVSELEKKIDVFDIDPALMTGPDAENREADLDKKTAKRDADTKKKGK